MMRYMRYMKTTVLALVAMFVAQVAAAQFSIQCGVTGNPQVVYTADILRLAQNVSGGSGQRLFFIRLNNVGASRRVKLRLVFAKDGQQVAQGTSTSNPLSGTVELDNNNIGTSIWSPTGFTISEAQARILSGGNTVLGGTQAIPTVLPAGTYTLICTLLDGETDAELTQCLITIILTNPTGFVNLISPGAAIGTTPVEVVYTTTPFFLWQGDARRYEITVWEDARGTGNFNDVVNTIPHVRQEVSSPSFQYPTAGARLMEKGKRYFWRIRSIFEAAIRGDQAVESQPFMFEIAGDDKLAELKKVLNERYSIPQDQLDNLVSFIRFRGVVNGVLEENNANLETLIRVLKTGK